MVSSKKHDFVQGRVLHKKFLAVCVAGVENIFFLLNCSGRVKGLYNMFPFYVQVSIVCGRQAHDTNITTDNKKDLHHLKAPHCRSKLKNVYLFYPNICIGRGFSHAWCGLLG